MKRSELTALAEDPAQTTRRTYEEIAQAFLARTRDRGRTRPYMERFVERVRSGGLVLDLGCGPGFDGAELRRLGLRAICSDLSRAMLHAGLAEFPGPRVRADNRVLPFASGVASGVWANACLLHLDASDLPVALREISRVCRPGAPVHLSMKGGRGAGWDPGPYGRPRWFQYWEAESLDALLRDEGFSILDARREDGRSASWLMRLVSCPES